MAMHGVCASGYRWDDALSIVLFGEMALNKNRELGDESFLATLVTAGCRVIDLVGGCGDESL